MSLNHAILMGTIDRGPELRMTQSGVPQTTFTLAIARPARDRGGSSDATDKIKVVAWRALAERVGESCQKGDTVVVEGRLQIRQYETQDGQRKKDMEMDASNVTAMGVAPKAGGARGIPTTDDEPPPDPWESEGGGSRTRPAPARGGGHDDFGDLEGPPPAKAPRSTAPPARRAPPPEPDLDDDIPF